jgi:enterochelin esterase family protein
MRRKFVKLCAAALLFAAAVSAQEGQQALVSPQVLDDHRIAFRVRAPKASEVILRFGDASAQTHPMTKAANGVWSVTIGPVEPEIYTYSFIVDGAKVIDPVNPILNVGVAVEGSVVEVPGNPPRFDQVQDVPHGSINIHTYTSSVSKTQRGLYVYVPPDYYTQPTKRFPVLYLFHGGGGAEQQWSRNGRAGVILDNLIAQKKAVPMLIVMPNNIPGNPAAFVTRANDVAPVNPTGYIPDNYPLLKREVREEIIPFVAKHYRTIENRESRAIAGLSGGAGTTMTVGMGSLDTFAWIAEFSAGIFGGNANLPQHYDVEKVAPGFYADPAATNKKLKLFYMSVGTEDPRLPSHKEALKEFQDHKIDVTFATFSGAHEWKVWRHSLNDVAPKLFR